MADGCLLYGVLGGEAHGLTSYRSNQSGAYMADQGDSLRSRYLFESGNKCFMLAMLRTVKMLKRFVKSVTDGTWDREASGMTLNRARLD